jgi:ppGpp synthetase/RelA/SpoT-type nucleotidyltranferase
MPFLRWMEPISIMEEYDAQRGLYSDYALTLQSLIRDLLAADNFRPHSIQQRVKGRTSLARKVLSHVEYVSANDITDIVGVRIITYFADEVDAVAELVERQFKVYKKSDWRTEHDLNEFGYRSLHYVLGLNTGRSSLLEYKRFADLKFEIQIRSILDHAWAEIYHDRGYKGGLLIPPTVQRHFSELAASLGNIDRQFQGLRDEIQEHGRTLVWKTAREEGTAELIGDIMFEIRKEQFPLVFQSSPWDIVVFFNTNVSARIVGAQYASEAIAFANGKRVPGRQDSASSLVFMDAIPEETRELGVCRVRVANVRLNVFQLGPKDTPTTATIEARSRAIGERVKLADQVEVGRRRAGLAFRVCGHDGGQVPVAFTIAAGVNTSLAADLGAKDANVNFELCFREGFPGAFRTDLQEAGTGGAKVDFGTRLRARLSGLPDKVEVYATATDISGDPANRSHCKARLIMTNIVGNSAPGPGVPAKATAAARLKPSHRDVQLVCLERSGTTAWAVWEWTDGDTGRTTPEEVRFGVVIAAKAGEATLGSVLVTGELAPLSNVVLASSTDPIPRFASVGSNLEACSFRD